MTKISMKGSTIHTQGNFPEKGEKCPNFSLVTKDLSEACLLDFGGRWKVLNIFPSVDTPVCGTSVRKFFEALSTREDTVLLNISMDLPFAQQRFCASAGIPNATSLSAFRSDFSESFGVKISDGPLMGLCARAVLVLDHDNRVVYSELVPEITQEPDYDAVFEQLV